jgi:hypothetical protein
LVAVLSAGIVVATLNLLLPQEAAEDAQGAEEVDAESQLQAQKEKWVIA